MVKKIAIVFLGVMLLFMYLPIIWLFLFSFSGSTSVANFGGITFDAYTNLFSGTNSSAIVTALVNTLIIALIASSISTVLGTFAAIGVMNFKRRGIREVYKNVSQIPLVNADIITAVSIMLLFVMLRTTLNVPIKAGYTTVILAHITFCTPYVVLNVLPRMSQIDNSVYEAALDLGATPFKAIWKVIIPDILPGIIMGFVLAFTLSIDDFVITKYNIQGFNTLSTYIYAKAGGKKPLPIEIRALSSIIFVVVLSLLLFINKKTQINKKEIEGVLK
jgi:spermidine/putrescine transport system permease protein